MKKILVFTIVSFLTTCQTYANQNIVIKKALTIDSDIEMLLDHNYHNGIKVKSIKIKQVEINKNTYIKQGNIINGEPNWLSVIIEITDMQNNVTQIYGGQSLQLGDYTYTVSE